MRLRDPNGQPLVLGLRCLQRGLANWGGRGVVRADGCLDDGVVEVLQVMMKTSTSVEGWVKGSGVDSFLDTPGHLVGFGVQVCDVLRTEVMA
jgi:hypothetical protein